MAVRVPTALFIRLPVMKDDAKKTWTINDKEYDLDTLSDDAKSQIVNIQVVDSEIAKLQQQLAIMQTA